MKRFIMLFVACIICVCGCMSVKLGEFDRPAAPVIAPAPGSAAAIAAAAVPVATLFKWDSALDPVNLPRATESAEIAATNSGFPNDFMRVRGSAIPTSNGALVLGGGGGRLIIGNHNPAISASDTAANTDHIPGKYDFSAGTYRLTVDYRDAKQGTANYVLRFYINNNGMSEAFSVLGRYSNLRTYVSEGDLAKGISEKYPQRDGTVAETGTPGKIVLTFTPSVRYTSGNATNADPGVKDYNSLKTAYMVLHCQPGANITITGIMLERMSQ